MGNSPKVFSVPPWVRWRVVAPPGGRRAPREGQSHLGDGPGTAAPGVQHDCIFVSFLQHFILKSKTRSSGRNSPEAKGFSSAPLKPRCSVRSVHQQHPHPLGGSLGMQSLRPQPGWQNQNLHSGTFPGDAPPRCNISVRSTGLSYSHQTPRTP